MVHQSGDLGAEKNKIGGQGFGGEVVCFFEDSGFLDDALEGFAALLLVFFEEGVVLIDIALDAAFVEGEEVEIFLPLAPGAGGSEGARDW